MGRLYDLPARDAINDADQKLQQCCHTIDTSQLIVLGYATQDSRMGNEMSTQRMLQIVQDQLK